MKIDQPWLYADAPQKVCAAVMAEGAEVYFVGGCVRNALMGVAVTDLDISTNAYPDEVLRLAKQAGIKAIPTGIDHGTVTLIQDGIPHEITTFRKDVATDGRRAVVAFTSDVAEDAARRDFTMNAIYARPDGTVVDPLGGMADLRAHRVRFIGDAETRIREDYLRSLRYFRFYAHYGDAEAGFDAEALAAIAANPEGLAALSRERIGSEFLKLLAADDPSPAVAAMRQTGVLAQILPGTDDRALAPLVHLEQDLPADPIRRLVALGASEGMQQALRLSNEQMRRLTRLSMAATGVLSAAELGYRLGPGDARDSLLLRAALLEQPLMPDMEAQIDLGVAACFPVKAADLMPDLAGADLGKALKRLERLWIDSGFELDKQALMRVVQG